MINIHVIFIVISPISFMLILHYLFLELISYLIQIILTSVTQFIFLERCFFILIFKYPIYFANYSLELTIPWFQPF